MSEEIENITNEEELHRNELLAMVVQPDSQLKDMLVEYVGTKFDKEDVTVNMIAETLAHEFPDFMYAMAEENFIRGYQLGLDDAYKSFSGKPEETFAEKL
jgi:hypothetical protein|tara:strand:- start:15584 stop:15883 length:300 start_codon:yes stop_codon:yes gene_type:complete